MQEVCVLLLDVGPYMHPAIAFAIRAASAFVLSKVCWPAFRLAKSGLCLTMLERV